MRLDFCDVHLFLRNIGKVLPRKPIIFLHKQEKFLLFFFFKEKRVNDAAQLCPYTELSFFLLFFSVSDIRLFWIFHEKKEEIKKKRMTFR